jgi:hypothetical protein
MSAEMQPLTPGSPFDAIRETDADGTETWRARKLQTLMGYRRYENLAPAIERARAAARNQGVDVDANFRGSQEVAGRSGPARKDFRLTRFAAYLVAMNGDPNKPEVAAAQAYFAAKTRQAEIAELPPVVHSTLTWEHAAAVARIHHGLNVDPGQLRRLLTQAGVLTLTGRPHKKWEAFFWPAPTGTRWEIHPAALSWLIRQAIATRRNLALAQQRIQPAIDFAALDRELPGGAQ